MNGDVAPGERQLSGLADPLELGDRAEVDLLLREDPARAREPVRVRSRSADAQTPGSPLTSRFALYSDSPCRASRQLLHRSTLR